MMKFPTVLPTTRRDARTLALLGITAAVVIFLYATRADAHAGHPWQQALRLTHQNPEGETWTNYATDHRLTVYAGARQVHVDWSLTCFRNGDLDSNTYHLTAPALTMTRVRFHSPIQNPRDCNLSVSTRGLAPYLVTAGSRR